MILFLIKFAMNYSQKKKLHNRKLPVKYVLQNTKK